MVRTLHACPPQASRPSARPLARRSPLPAPALVRCVWLVLSLLLGSGNLSAAENFALANYNVHDGLPTNAAPFVRQTLDGYIWIGSEGGLVRFDGATFQVFRTGNTPELPANLIRALVDDPVNGLWIGTQGGLALYRDGTFTRIGTDDGPVGAVAVDGKGTAWIAALSRGLHEYRDGRRRVHGPETGAPSGQRADFVTVDAEGVVWWGGQGLLFRYRDGRHERVEPPEGTYREIISIFESVPGTRWLNTDQGLFRQRGAEMTRFGAAQGFPGGKIESFHLDQDGRFWVIGSGLFVFRDGNEPHFERLPLPAVQNPRSLLRDHEGSHWVGTAGDGVYRVRPSGFRMASPPDGLFGSNTRTVAIAPDGAVWAGLPRGGVARIAPDGTTTTIATGNTPEDLVWSVCPTRDGRVWIGTRSTLRVWENGTLRELPEFVRIRALYEDRRGVLWIGSESLGVTTYRNGKYTTLTETIRRRHPDPNAMPPIGMVFAEDARGRVLVGLRESALLVIDGDDYQFHVGRHTFDLRALYEDASGDLWVGGKGRGLAVLRKGRWLNPEGLTAPFSDLVSSIAEDAAGRLWLGSPRGIIWGSKAELLEVAEGRQTSTPLRQAVEGDGVRPAEVGFGSSPNTAVGADGTLYYGTRGGLTIVTPGALVANPTPPPVHLQRLTVDGQIQAVASENILAAGTRFVALDYTACSYISPTHVRFRYRLEGWDKEWIEAGNRRSAVYAKLRPGTYRFRVIACNDNGVWNETGASVTLVQRPAFYETVWFVAATVLGLVGVSAGFYRWRVASLRRHNEELRQGIAARTAELAQSYEEVQASQYFYHSLVESLPQIIVRRDAEGRCTYANEAYGQLVGRAVRDLVGRDLGEIYPAEAAAKHRASDRRVMETRTPLEYETTTGDDRRGRRFLHVKKVPLHDNHGRPLGVQVIFWDMTGLRAIEQQLKESQQHLIEASRRAALAEMATGILHNLGNALTSVTTTASLALTRLRDLRVASVTRIGELLAGQKDNLPAFFAQDPRGQQVPDFLSQLGRHLDEERGQLVRDLEALRQSVEHIRGIVSAQQDQARARGVVETVPPSELVEYALRIEEASLQRHGILLAREFMPVPRVQVERHKVLQVLSNLLRNARESVDAANPPEKRITVNLQTSPTGGAEIAVSDNGVGLSEEQMTRIFAFGYTTKSNGHGFGLHSSILAAKELGGTLTARSDGRGKGATFVLHLPAADEAPGKAAARAQ